MSVRRIIETFEAWRQRGETLVLATVYDTLGSTYTKPGHRILIAANGDYQGLVSGGCLEGDLAGRARSVVASGVPLAVTYDLRDDADDLWGLGVGCNGLIRVFLQPLTPGEGYEPFASIAGRLVGRAKGMAATVIASARADAPAGATLVLDADGAAVSASGGLAARGPTAAMLAAGARRALETGRAEHARDVDGFEALYVPLVPVPRVLVLGGGLDAVPVVDFAADLGWFVTVADHRPAYLERGGFAKADGALEVDPRRLPERIALDEFDAILIMSHHLETDRTYLSHLIDVPARYLGVLGPPARRARLLDLLGENGEALRARLRGPVGLDLGADSPESIALSIVAELQAVFAHRPGR